ncbi:D-glycero-alpha-D-manno-heptose-1,7-bisphosphate 7-phosphatase [Streptomyces sp. NPDC001339]|uniref:D-glycero-alpha-D-manno-heptose-1,7-bisphosphate 7-phosphatase n=1 Tax=Streptomyces sp. NPDC001339 TaxID=3364563 RepID=UPI0036AEFC63
MRQRKRKPRKYPGTFFLDRDGTLNRKPRPGEYVTDPGELILLPGAAAAVRRLNDHGRRVVLVTNQRGVARGIMSGADLAAVHRRLVDLLRDHGAHLDGYYVCPHEEGACGCRKPRPGLLQAAARDFGGIDPADSVMIGDTESDVLAGKAAGCATVLLSGTGPPLLGPTEYTPETTPETIRETTRENASEIGPDHTPENPLAHGPAKTAADLVVPDLRSAVDLLLKFGLLLKGESA